MIKSFFGMEVDLLSLRVFVAVVEKGSLSEAARSLGLTQPAVTYQVKRLEESFGLPIVKRGKLGIRLTPAGETLYRYAKRLTDLHDELMAVMEGYREGVSETLKVGVCPVAGELILPMIADALKDHHPELKLSTQISYFPPILDGLLSGELDVGIIEIRARHKGIMVEELLKEPFLLVASPDQVTEGANLSLKDLQGTKIFLREEAVGIKATVEGFLNSKGMRLNDFEVVSVAGSNEAIKKMIKEGMGVSFFPMEMVRQDLERGELKEIPLKEGVPVLKFFLAYRKRRVYSQKVKMFIGLVKDLFAEGQKGYKDAFVS